MTDTFQLSDQASEGGARPRVAVVLSGAIARGAFQAGALGAVLSRTKGTIPDPSIFVGTSAGAINAVLWAKYSNDLGVGADPRAVAARVRDVWLDMPAEQIYDPPLSWSPRRIWHNVQRLEWPALRGFFRGGTGMTSLLDTTPLQQKAAELLKEGVILPPSVDALGVVATWVPPATTTGSASGRSTLFLQENVPSEWSGSAARALDVRRCPITKEHMLTSCAVPIGFPAQLVDGLAAGWYVDGAIRLNTPLLAAIRLHATHIILISAMSVGYACRSSVVGSEPHLIDAASQVMHALLADRTVEDLLAVQRINRLLQQTHDAGVTLTASDGRIYQPIKVAVVAPEPGSLRNLAGAHWTAKDARWPALLRLKDNAVLGRLLRGAGDDASFFELLSYVFFDRGYMDASYHAGVRAANALFDQPAEPDQTPPWRMTKILSDPAS
jgi:NTE family protein